MLVQEEVLLPLYFCILLDNNLDTLGFGPDIGLIGITSLVKEPEDGVQKGEDTEEEADEAKKNNSEKEVTVTHVHGKLLVSVTLGEFFNVAVDIVVLDTVVAAVSNSLDATVYNIEVTRVINPAVAVYLGANTNSDDGHQHNHGVYSQHQQLEGLEAEEPADGANDVTSNANQSPEETESEGPVVPARSRKTEGNTQTNADTWDNNHNLGGAVGTLDNLSLVQEGSSNHGQNTNDEKHVPVVNQQLVELGAEGLDGCLGEVLYSGSDTVVTTLEVQGTDTSSE
ncbi:porphobilinogen deaminase, putative [Babesia ovis]|uniref:Porphobilinogen deaminase, putative n=1 Tax=Babesia ovis TaxID=5869 RepID=A0A9W5T959_BABOV|nr:porphobilinogen deaminase, putative [Babesia ovis]